MNRYIATLVIGSMMLAACGSNDESEATNSVEAAPWRVLVDDHQTGGPIDPGTHIATESDTFDELWALLGNNNDQPSVDFDEEVVIAYAVTYPSGCEFPFIGLDIDEPNTAIRANYAGNEPAMCAADENQYLVMVGIDRDALTQSRYEVTTSVGGPAATLHL